MFINIFQYIYPWCPTQRQTTIYKNLLPRCFWHINYQTISTHTLPMLQYSWMCEHGANIIHCMHTNFPPFQSISNWHSVRHTSVVFYRILINNKFKQSPMLCTTTAQRKRNCWTHFGAFEYYPSPAYLLPLLLLWLPFQCSMFHVSASKITKWNDLAFFFVFAW